MILEDYLRNFERFGHLDRIRAFVIPDRKTPAAAYERCANLCKKGLKVVCPTLDEQETYLSKFGGLGRLIPYNSDNRRNIGFLMALESGAQFMLSIDDDNYCLPDEDFVKFHSVACGEPTTECAVSSESGWFNICDMLEIEPATTVYPRGFPYFARHKNPKISRATQECRVHINAGLWLSEPDRRCHDMADCAGARVRHARRFRCARQFGMVAHQHAEHGHPSGRATHLLLLFAHGVSACRHAH